MADERPMQERVLRELRNGPARGQYDLGRRVLGDRYSLEQWEEFHTALDWHMTWPPRIVEEKTQLPGTGHEGPPVYEYTYRLATPAEKELYK